MICRLSSKKYMITANAVAQEDRVACPGKLFFQPYPQSATGRPVLLEPRDIASCGAIKSEVHGVECHGIQINQHNAIVMPEQVGRLHVAVGEACRMQIQEQSCEGQSLRFGWEFLLVAWPMLIKAGGLNKLGDQPRGSPEWAEPAFDQGQGRGRRNA